MSKAGHEPLDLDEKALENLPTHLQRTLRYALEQAPQDIPRMQLARSLEEAGPRTFVYIDNQGRVRSPVQYRAMQVMSYSLLTAILLGGTALYSYLLGPQGLIFGLVFGLAIGRNLFYTRQINQAALLSSHDRLDEAELILHRLIKRRLLGRRLRALCHHNLGAVATRRGDHSQALEQLRRAISLYQAAWPRSPHLRSCQYGEIIALCNLGRADEARQHWQALPKQSEGDYLLIKAWTTELYVAFSSDQPPPGDSDLWDRARRALRITSSSALLGLCAWAFVRAKDQDIAWHLLREAYDRLDGEPLFLIMPPLWRWMEQSRPLAGAAA
jgi:tetratricopeptide (TPR) repeat protein